MASLAMILRRVEAPVAAVGARVAAVRALAAEPRRETRMRTNPYLLRTLPNEDVYFHVKHIDNSRLVRQADPRGGAENWTAIGAVCALMIVLFTSLAPGVAGIISGYQIQALKQEQQRLLNERSLLEVEEARLTSPERLDHLARERNMAIPTRAQLVHLPSTAKEAVAMNARRARH